MAEELKYGIWIPHVLSDSLNHISHLRTENPAERGLGGVIVTGAIGAAPVERLQLSRLDRPYSKRECQLA